MKKTATKHPRRLPGLLCKGANSAYVVTNPNTTETLVTNRVGKKIIDLADGSRSVGEIVAAISAEYPAVSARKIETQVHRFLELARKRMLLCSAIGIETSEHIDVIETRDNNTSTFANFAKLAAESAAEHENEMAAKASPRGVYWYPTFRCNLACAHCAVNSCPEVDTTHDLNTEGCLRVIDQIAEMKVSMVILSGGEFLVRPDALTILKALADREIRIGLETNGLLIGSGFVSLARDLQKKQLLTFNISLDGGTKEAHEALRGVRSFERTVRNLRRFAQAGLNFGVQCVLTVENYHTIPDLYRLAKELAPRCSSVSWAVLNPTGRGVELAQEVALSPIQIPNALQMIQEHKTGYEGITTLKFPPAMVPPAYFATLFSDQNIRWATSCGFPMLGILPDGQISICAHSRNHPGLQLGHVNRRNLKKAWMDAGMDDLRRDYISAERLQGICGDCIWKGSCRGGCRIDAVDENGELFAPFRFCQEAYEKGLFPDGYRISKHLETEKKIAV